MQPQRPEILWEITRSLCPQCRRVIDGQVLFRDNKVILRKRCPDHGWFEALIFSDANLYVDVMRFNKPGTPPGACATEVRDGCPLDCGLCTEHKQHACLGIIEVNAGCNLDCPLCFAGSGTHLLKSGFELSYEQVEFMLDRFVAAEGSPEVLQFSGGEPTLHPRIVDFIELAQSKGITHVLLNTNGVRIARDDQLLAELARLRPHIYLQFDGFDPATNLALRGRADLLETKLLALDRLAAADMTVTLVAAVERDVNEHEIGPIVEFGLRHPAVFGVSFQPAFRTQRHIPRDPLSRITIPDVLRALEEQTDGLFRLSDFIPVPCCMPTCNFVTYALLQGDSVTPITRWVEVDRYLDYLQNRTIPGLRAELVQLLERLWSSSAVVGSHALTSDIRALIAGASVPPQGDDLSADRCTACRTSQPLIAHAPRDLVRHIFMINTRDFLDEWTFSVKNVMKCCVEMLVPDGRMIPFCAYNTVGYREQVRDALTGVPAAVLQSGAGEG